MKLNLHIERLILDSLPVERRASAAIQAAVEVELHRLFAAGDLSMVQTMNVAVPRIAANPLELSSAIEPKELGAQVAQSVYQSINHQFST